MATYGSFPGVRVTTESGSVASVGIGEEENLVLFGEADYVLDTSGSTDELVVEGNDPTLDVSANSPEQINAPREAEAKFGTDSELAQAMKEALANGANIDFLYGVPVGRSFVEAESKSTLSGTLDNYEIVENTGAPVDSTGDTIGDQGIDVVSDGGAGTDLTVEFRYNGAPSQPGDADTVFINPLTGEYSASSGLTTPLEFDYTYNDYGTAFSASGVKSIVNEGETGVYFALTDSDAVSASLETEVSDLRTNYQLVNGFMIAEPNDSEVLDASNTTNANGGADARYNTGTYGTANQSVDAEYFYKFAPGREENVVKTIGGGIAGLFAGNAITNPVYNDALAGYDALEQSLSKTDADNLRAEDIIPIRSGGAIRVKGNRSTAYSNSDAVAADFWTRRITDRVILIGRQIGENTLGKINDEDTRDQAERAIEAEMRDLVDDNLILENGEDQNWRVDVYQSSTNDEEVKIDIAFTPYGIVKQVDETITVNTN